MIRIYTIQNKQLPNYTKSKFEVVGYDQPWYSKLRGEYYF